MESVFCRVSADVIEPACLLDFVPRSSHGAEAVFFGLVRDVNLGKKVVAVSYDSFEPLAEKVFRELCDEAQNKWGADLQIRLLHRTGTLKVGEISVAIAVSSRHRDESYQASRYIIEQLKVRAPIWKKEHYEDGETDWVRGHALCGHSHHDHHGDITCGRSVHPHGN